MKLTKEEVIKSMQCCLKTGSSCADCPLDNYHLICHDVIYKNAIEHLTSNETSYNAINIHKIIDEAMEKKDRSVTIFIGAQGTTVNVYPYQETEPHWICKDGGYICSECGSKSDNFPYLHCPTCGEKLKFKEWTDEGKKDEAETTVE